MSETCVLSTLVLSCESESSSSGGPHHLSWISNTLQVTCSFIPFTISFPILHLFFHFPLRQLSLCLCCSLSSIFNSVNIIFLLPFYVLSYSAKHNHLHLILCFSFAFGSELSYLTIWLSSCPVRIFPRSYTIIAKTQIINKVSPLKWTNLKSTHITRQQIPSNKMLTNPTL